MKLDREKLQLARARHGWSTGRTADEAGLSNNSVLRAEHEEEVSVGTVHKLATALGVDVAELVREVPPKALSRSSTESPEEVSGEERRLSYVWSQMLQVERMRERWEEAAEQNTFSYEAWNEAAEVTIEIEQAFADAVPVAIYATGEKWLPQEEWDAVAELLGNITVLNRTIQRAFHVYQSRFGEKGVPADVKDFAAIREQRKREAQARSHTNEQDHRAG